MTAENLASEQSLGEIERFDHDCQLFGSGIQADSGGVLPTAVLMIVPLLLDPPQSFTTDCFRDAKSGETVRPFPSPLLRQIHLAQQRFEARVAIERYQRRICFDSHQLGIFLSEGPLQPAERFI